MLCLPTLSQLTSHLIEHFLRFYTHHALPFLTQSWPALLFLLPVMVIDESVMVSIVMVIVMVMVIVVMVVEVMV